MLLGSAAALASSVCWSQPAARAAGAAEDAQAQVVTVRPGGSISGALAAARDAPGLLVIQVEAGRYRDRLVVTRPNTIITAHPTGASVTIEWETKEPYQSVVDCTAKSVTLSGLTLKHASKSVANNYGVYIHDGSDLVMERCEVTSTTGTGIGIEGAAPTIRDCRISGCARHGVAVFGGLGDSWEDAGGAGSTSGGVIEGCDVGGNAGDGVLVRAGAAPRVSRCAIHDNRGHGISLQDASGEYVNNAVKGNAGGALVVVGGFDFDAGVMVRANSLSGKVQV